MDPATITAPGDWTAMLARLAVAVALGAVIGWEREGRNRGAGLRTNMMVSLGACVFMVLGLKFAETNDSADVAKVVAGIVGGVGFLGAGAIIQFKGQVRGLTTAAGIWTCAAIGATAGSGLYSLALMTSLAALVILLALYPLKEEIKKDEDEDADGEEA